METKEDNTREVYFGGCSSDNRISFALSISYLDFHPYAWLKVIPVAYSNSRSRFRTSCDAEPVKEKRKKSNIDELYCLRCCLTCLRKIIHFLLQRQKNGIIHLNLPPKYWHFVRSESSNKSSALLFLRRVKYSQMSAYALLDLYVAITIFNQASIILCVLLVVAAKNFMWQLQISELIKFSSLNKYLELFPQI